MICLTDAKEDKQKEGGRGKRERDFVMNIPCETFCGVDEAQSLSSFFFFSGAQCGAESTLSTLSWS